MSIPFKYNLKQINKELSVKINLIGNDSDWMAWWYCGIYMNRRDRAQPHVLLAFRKLLPDGLSEEVIYRRVLLTALGQVRIGSVWRDSICRSEAIFDTGFFSVDFSEHGWRYNSFHNAANMNILPPYPSGIHPLQYRRDKNWLIEFRLRTGGRLIIPCLEFFSRCYGRSEEVKRILATFPWPDENVSHGNRLYAPWRGPEEPGKWNVRLRKRLVNEDIVFIAHVKYDPYTRWQAKSIYAQIESQHDPEYKRPAFIKIAPWFRGKATIGVKGLWFNNKRSFLGLQVVGCTEPQGAMILRDREYVETDKAENSRREDDATEPIGMPERNISNVKGTIELTGDQAPDHGEATIELQDPDFVVLGSRRAVADVFRKQPKGAIGGACRPAKSADPSEFSTGDPYGQGKGVGYASISSRQTMDSRGTLRDMWDAMHFLMNKRSDLIKTVEWFTFERGFCTDPEPMLISLKPFKKESNVGADIKNWPYLDLSTKKYLRGVLVSRMLTAGKFVHIIEIQRRVLMRLDSNTRKVSNVEESFRGLAFILDENSQLVPWLRRFFSEIRSVKGIVQYLTASCPGKAVTFKHVTGRNDQVPCESAVSNAMNKLGIKNNLKKRDDQNAT